MLGAVEAGGTKFVCAVGMGPDDLQSIEIPTLEPGATLAKVIDFFRAYQPKAVGVGCFGPIDLKPASATFGRITKTPKLAWRGCDILGTLLYGLDLPIAIDTDVNAAALGEREFGAAQGLTNFVYFTVGTGIGGGAISDGRIVRGVMHPEMGHMPVRRHPDDRYAGICPSHGDCLEGLASGPAIAGRWGQRCEDLPPDHPAWKLEAYYLAQAALTAALLFSPQSIVFGGGVTRQRALLELVQHEFQAQLNGYLMCPPDIVFSGLPSAGLVGALYLARGLVGAAAPAALAAPTFL